MTELYADNFSVNDKTGWVVFSDKGLYTLKPPQEDSKQPQNTIFKKNRVTKELAAYFKGKKAAFNAKIDWVGFSSFEKKILEKCQLIKYGETVSYKELALMANCKGAWRAVGNTLAKNRLPIIIPCHRVIKSDGELGGFSQGLPIKKKLLELEKNGNN